MKKHRIYLPVTALSILLTHATTAFAVEAAPQISDREIVERLTRLEVGQQSIQKQMQSMQKQTEQQIASLQVQTERQIASLQAQTERQIASLEQQIASLQKQTEQQISALDKRVSERMDAQWNLTLILIGAIFGLIGFVVWDRKTALKPLEKRFETVANELERDLDTPSSEGSKLARIIRVLWELAPENPQLADALQRHSLFGGLPPKAA